MWRKEEKAGSRRWTGRNSPDLVWGPWSPPSQHTWGPWAWHPPRGARLHPPQLQPFTPGLLPRRVLASPTSRRPPASSRSHRPAWPLQHPHLPAPGNGHGPPDAAALTTRQLRDSSLRAWGLCLQRAPGPTASPSPPLRPERLGTQCQEALARAGPGSQGRGDKGSVCDGACGWS